MVPVWWVCRLWEEDDGESESSDSDSDNDTYDKEHKFEFSQPW
jgi:hypothetical protein